VLDDAANGLICIYPTEGLYSISRIWEEYRDMDVLLQNATYYLSADGSPAVIDLSELF
jgi:hypothetical protein